MNRVFLGKPSHWALWGVIVVVLAVAGHVHMHVRWFNDFTVLLLALTLFVVLFVVVTYRPGERITREPFDLDQPGEHVTRAHFEEE